MPLEECSGLYKGENLSGEEDGSGKQAELAFPALNVSTERAARRVLGPSLEQVFLKKQRPALPKELLHLFRLFLSTANAVAVSSSHDAEFWCRKPPGHYLLQRQPRTILEDLSLTAQTAWTALNIRKLSLPWEGISWSATFIIGPWFHPLEWHHSFIPHTGACRT